MQSKKFSFRLLLFTTLLISGCSLIYELLISAVSSYLVGDSITQFSITIGIYMFSMGIGSYLSKYINKNLFDWFVFIEIFIGIIGGISALILFLSFIYIKNFDLCMYILIIIIGTFVGLEIPILTRVIQNHSKDLKTTLARIFSIDYIGGLIGALLFPLLLLPKFGYFTTAFMTGLMNVTIACLVVYKYNDYLVYKKTWKMISILCVITLFIGMLFSENMAKDIENGLYRDQIIYSEQSLYQKIILTKHEDDLRLYIDGNIQFSSKDEYRYHESLIHIPMSVAKNKKRVLILGGGDGLAAREIFKYDEVSEVVLVDLDEELVDLCKTHKEIANLNENSLNSPKINIFIQDAHLFLQNNKNLFDVIIVDLPDPNNDSLNKLYTNLFYRLCNNNLTEDGVLCIQSTSPYYAKEAFWCINKTIRSENFFVTPYHIQVPAFGDWGFQLATKKEVDLKNISVINQTKFLDNNMIDGLFYFAKDEIVDLDLVEINSLSNPKLLSYYIESVKKWK